MTWPPVFWPVCWWHQCSEALWEEGTVPDWQSEHQLGLYIHFLATQTHTQFKNDFWKHFSAIWFIHHWCAADILHYWFSATNHKNQNKAGEHKPNVHHNINLSCLSLINNIFKTLRLKIFRRIKNSCGWGHTNMLALTAAESFFLTDSQQLHSKASLPSWWGEDRPPVQEVGWDQRCLIGGVCSDQHQVNWVTHGQHGGCVCHFTSIWNSKMQKT